MVTALPILRPMDTARDMDGRFPPLGMEGWEAWEAILLALGPQLMALLRTGNEDVFFNGCCCNASSN